MSHVLIDEEILSSIAEELRYYSGEQVSICPKQMPEFIQKIALKNYGTKLNGLILVQGDCESVFANDVWTKLLEPLADYDPEVDTTPGLVTFGNVKSAVKMFKDSGLLDRYNTPYLNKYRIPLKAQTVMGEKAVSLNEMFSDCSYLKSAPNFYRPIDNFAANNPDLTDKPIIHSFYRMFYGCSDLQLPQDYFNQFDLDNSFGEGFGSQYKWRLREIFTLCGSKIIPLDVYRYIYKLSASDYTSQIEYGEVSHNFWGCFRVEKLEIPSREIGCDFDANCFDGCMNLSSLTFDVIAPNANNNAVSVGKGENGAQTALWSTTIRLGRKAAGDAIAIAVGHLGSLVNLIAAFHDTGEKINSDNYLRYQYEGMPTEWYAGSADYSKYNLTSAIETLYSLPDLHKSYTTSATSIEFLNNVPRLSASVVANFSDGSKSTELPMRQFYETFSTRITSIELTSDNEVLIEYQRELDTPPTYVTAYIEYNDGSVLTDFITYLDIDADTNSFKIRKLDLDVSKISKFAIAFGASWQGCYKVVNIDGQFSLEVDPICIISSNDLKGCQWSEIPGAVSYTVNSASSSTIIFETGAGKGLVDKDDIDKVANGDGTFTYKLKDAATLGKYSITEGNLLKKDPATGISPIELAQIKGWTVSFI